MYHTCVTSCVDVPPYSQTRTQTDTLLRPGAQTVTILRGNVAELLLACCLISTRSHCCSSNGFVKSPGWTKQRTKKFLYPARLMARVITKQGLVPQTSVKFYRFLRKL